MTTLIRRDANGLREWQEVAAAPEDEQVAPAGVFAWKCENCNEWRPAATAPFAVVVDEPTSSEVVMEGGYTKRVRTRRVMVVCPTCHGDMGGSA